MVNHGMRIIQFHHNGGEHLVTEENGSFKANNTDRTKILAGGRMPWNDGEHKRKFIRNNGRYIDANGELHEGELMFWGEYEGVSKVEKISYERQPAKGMPNYIHKPLAMSLKDYVNNPDFPYTEGVKGWQNTDPYVLGKCFMYSNCHQGNHEFMRNLSRGTVIVMGSKNGVYRADTVLVIDKPLATYSKNDFSQLEELLRKGEISQTYWETTFVPLLGLNNPKAKRTCGNTNEKYVPQFTLYKTVTYEERGNFNGMFSFFPCKPFKEGRGFERAAVSNEKYINPGYGMGVKGNQIIMDETEVYNLWNDIRHQVLNDGQGLNLGIWAEEPSLPSK
jgi:hypothetical protein